MDHQSSGPPRERAQKLAGVELLRERVFVLHMIARRSNRPCTSFVFSPHLPWASVVAIRVVTTTNDRQDKRAVDAAIIGIRPSDPARRYIDVVSTGSSPVLRPGVRVLQGSTLSIPAGGLVMTIGADGSPTLELREFRLASSTWLDWLHIALGARGRRPGRSSGPRGGHHGRRRGSRGRCTGA